MAYEVGGFSFNLDVNLKNFEKQLDKAFSIAKKKGAGLVWDTSSFVAGLKMTRKEFQAFGREVDKAKTKYEEILDLQKNLQSSDLWSQIGDEARNSVEEAVSAAKEEAQIYDRTLKHMGRAQRLKSIFNGLRKVFGGLFSAFRKQTAKAGSDFGGFLKRLLGIASVAALVRKAFSYAREGMQNLVQADATTANSVNSLRGALAALKNSFAAAFAPILSVVAPILVKFIGMLTAAANAVASFLSALTGRKFAVVASAVSDGFGGIGDSAGGANESAQELQRTLMGFDKINKLDSNSGAGSGGGGGGAGGGGGGGGFDLVPISDEVNSWADKFKESWENADFEWLGTLLAQKLNAALEKIPWDAIQDTARRLAKSFATFLNGFFGEESLWTTVGHTFAEVLNTIIEFGYTFVTEFSWTKFGKAISNAIDGFFERIDTSKAAKALSGAIKGILDTIITTLEETNWMQMGTRIGEFLAGIDWIGVAKKAGQAIVAAFKAVNAVFEGIGIAILQAIQDYLYNHLGIKIDLVGNVTKIDPDPKLNRDIDTTANLTSRKNSLSNNDKTIDAKANFTSRKNSLSKKDKTINTKAQFTSRKVALSKKEKTISGMTATVTKVDFSARAKQDLKTHLQGSGHAVRAKGGVFKNGSWSPIQRYASGGLPNGSQLFWAREKGPELVGTLGGHTAVMNNDQIVASVSAGVAKAIAGIRFKMSAPRLANVGSSPTSVNHSTETDSHEIVALLAKILTAINEQDLNVSLDGREIAKSTIGYINSETRRTGMTPLLI